MLALVLRLIIDGDIESNPGPTYVIEKAIHGSYHQGDQRLLLEEGVPVDCVYVGDQTPLFYAAWNNRTDVIRLLLENGANVNVHVILCMLFAGHKLKKCIHGIHQI